MTDSATGPPTGAPRILLVEDNDLNRALVRTVLTRTKHPILRDANLIEAGDLASARAEIASAQPDIVLLDMQLPDGSGLDLATELAAGEDSARPAIIALTAAVLPDQQNAALAACDTFLAKPYGPDELVTTLSAHLPSQTPDPGP